MTALAAASIGCNRSVIAFERRDFGARTEMTGEVEDVAHRRRPEGIDRLRIVADNSQTTTGWLQGQQDRRLQTVRILILINQHMIETRCHVFRD
jgi:hypothetical protein